MEKIERIFTRRVRSYLYRLAIAILAALQVYGLIEGDGVDALSLVIMALFGMADANVPGTYGTRGADKQEPYLQ